jgi:MarR family transcriptional regulator, lower aerobic nicotinate degradation pathway regulator
VAVHAPGSDERRAPERLRRLPSWLLNQATLQANRLTGEAFAGEGVRRHHFTVLVALRDNGPASQAELGRRLSIDRSDVVAVLNDLQRRDLVDRASDDRDRRRNLVRLTRTGAAALEHLEERVEHAQAALLEPLSADERRDLEDLLVRIIEHHGERHEKP